MKKLKFNKRKHEYTLGDKKLTSVTTWIKQHFNPFDAVGISMGITGDRKRAALLRKQWREIAKEGSLVHAEIEDYIRGNLDLTDLTRDKAKWATNAYHKIESEHNLLAVVPELQVHNEKYSLAGTIDCLLATTDGLVLVDWKTNKDIRGITSKPGWDNDCAWSHYCLQLSTYAYMLESSGKGWIHKLYLVHLKDDKYTIHSVPYLKEAVREMLENDLVKT